MFGRSTKKKAAKVQDPAAPPRTKDMNPSVIASNMCVLGNIVSDGILDIDGQVDGNVRGHIVTLRPNGRIRGDVVAEDVFIYGTVDGLIKATNVTLYESAIVRGTIMHESLTVEDGATVDGKLKRTERLLLPDMREREEVVPPQRSVPPIIDSTMPRMEAIFDNDNDEPQSEVESRILDNLRLIS